MNKNKSCYSIFKNLRGYILSFLKWDLKITFEILKLIFKSDIGLGLGKFHFYKMF